MNWRNLTFYVVLFLIIALAVVLKLHIFPETGGDHLQYKRAVLDFTSGINPYEYTVASFKTPGLDHGYAYPPTILYILSALWKLNVIFKANIATAILWKIPVLLADLGTTWLLIIILKKWGKLATLAGVAFWLFNPYFVVRYEYTLLDPIQIFLLLLALYLLDKKESASSMFFALAVSIKIVPIILLPIFLSHTKQLGRFVIIMLVTLLILCVPFLMSAHDLYYLINGAFLVHSERGIQGRPILSFISFYISPTGLSFLQEKFTSFYSVLALGLGSLAPLVAYKKGFIKNKYTLAALAFGIYFLISPVFNRTHLLWIIPFFVISVLTTYRLTTRLRYGCLLIAYLAFFWYLLIWTKGLKAPDILHQTIWMDKSETTNYTINILNAPKEVCRKFLSK